MQFLVEILCCEALEQCLSTPILDNMLKYQKGISTLYFVFAYIFLFKLPLKLPGSFPVGDIPSIILCSIFFLINSGISEKLGCSDSCINDKETGQAQGDYNYIKFVNYPLYFKIWTARRLTEILSSILSNLFCYWLDVRLQNIIDRCIYDQKVC